LTFIADLGLKETDPVFPLIEEDPCPFATLAMLKALSAIEDLRESKVGILGRRKYPPAG